MKKANYSSSSLSVLVLAVLSLCGNLNDYYQVSAAATSKTDLNVNDEIWRRKLQHEAIPNEGNYKILYSKAGETWWTTKNRTRYYCTFRNLWNPKRHPMLYPKEARWTPANLYSHTNQFETWKVGEPVSRGVEKVAEEGFTETLQEEVEVGRQEALDFSTSGGTGFYTDQEDYVHVPGVDVTYNFPYLSSVAGMLPSPDWFTGFYSFFVIEEYKRSFLERFIIQTFPIDAGTDDGQTYTADPDDTDPPGLATRYVVENSPSGGIYVSPDATEVLPVAEWDCVLQVGDTPYEWPPCDVLKFPNCNQTKCLDEDSADYDEKFCTQCNPDVPSCAEDMKEASKAAEEQSVSTSFTIVFSLGLLTATTIIGTLELLFV